VYAAEKPNSAKGVQMSTVKTAVQDQFGAVAENYRTSPVHARGVDIDRIVELVRQRPPSSVLDVGCGAGHVTAAVAPWSQRVVASDFTPAMLAQVEHLAAERGLTNIETHEADVEQLPFADASFEIVLSRYSAHHWQHPHTAIRECLRVVVPGGLLLISDIVADEEPALDTFLQTIEYLRDRSHVRDYRISEWLAIFNHAGAAATTDLTWDVPLEFGAWVKRMATPAPQVAMIQHLFHTAPADVQATFAIQADDHFTIKGALFAATRSR
jgi:ubiquinone/menaquinone biosynthesis C-methylase UbiE